MFKDRKITIVTLIVDFIVSFLFLVLQAVRGGLSINNILHMNFLSLNKLNEQREFSILTPPLVFSLSDYLSYVCHAVCWGICRTIISGPINRHSYNLRVHTFTLQNPIVFEIQPSKNRGGPGAKILKNFKSLCGSQTEGKLNHNPNTIFFSKISKFLYVRV